MFIKGKNLDQCIGTRKNNLDVIRFLAATFVLFSHAYPITTGNNASEPFAIWSKGQMTFGELAVSIFFIISGFLITQSFDRSQNPINYFKARVLRIFPALIFCVLLSVLIVGPVFTELTLKDYFKDPNTIEYLRTITLYFIQYDLPGVFQTNIWPNAVNGSLWTLWYEFFFYIVVAFLGITKLLDKRVVLGLLLLSFVLTFMGKGGFYVGLFLYFGAGMVFYLFRKRIILNRWFGALSFIILILSAKLGYFDHVFAIFGTYFIFYLAYETKLKLHNFGKYGDFSYGIYIYAFPIQQIMSYLFHNGLTPFENFLLSFPPTLLLAIASWYLVEKRALTYKKLTLKEMKERILGILTPKTRETDSLGDDYLK